VEARSVKMRAAHVGRVALKASAPITVAHWAMEVGAVAVSSARGAVFSERSV
jgi:hypothetical protein